MPARRQSPFHYILHHFSSFETVISIPQSTCLLGLHLILLLRHGFHLRPNILTTSSSLPPTGETGLNSNLAGVSLSVCSLCCCPVTSPVSTDAAGAWRAGQAISQIFRIVGNFFVHATHRIPMVEMLFMSFCAPHHRLLLLRGSLSCLDGVLVLRSTLTLPLHV